MVELVAPGQKVARRVQEREPVQRAFRGAEERPQRRRLLIAQVRVGQLPFRHLPRRVRQLDRAAIGGSIHHRPRPPLLLHRELAQRTASELWICRHGIQMFRTTVSFVLPRISPSVTNASSSAATLQLSYTCPSHGSVKEKLPNAPCLARKTSSIAASSPSSSWLNWISHPNRAPAEAR